MKLILRLSRVYLRPHKGKFFLVLIAAILSSLAPFTLAYLSKIMVDDVLEIGEAGSAVARSAPMRDASTAARTEARLDRDSQSGGARAEPSGRREQAPATSRARRIRLLWTVFVAYLGLRLLFVVLGWGYNYGINQIGQEMVYRLRQDVYAKLQSLQVSYFDRHQTGKIMARVMDDVNVVQFSVSGIFITFFRNVATLFVGAALLLQINAGLASIAMMTLPFYVITYQFFIRRIRYVSRLIREQNASLYGTIGDSVGGVRVVMSFARELRELRRFFSDMAEYLRLQIRNSVLNTALSILCGLISGVGTTLVIYFGILEIRDGRMTLGEFMYFYGSVGFLFTPVVALSNMNAHLQWVLTAVTRVFQVLDEEVQIYDPEDALDPDHIYGEVIFHDVTLKYSENGPDALHHVNFAVFPGQMVCLVGESGSGKSTLANLLLRLYEPTEGRITLDGEDIRDYALVGLRRHVRMVPQEPFLFSGTLAENIRYGQPEASPDVVIRSAKDAELHDFIMSQPGRYETHLGEGGVSLSGGQRQRMALAMTLITDPNVLILDDSTSALDAVTESRIHRTLERLQVHRSTFVITHKVSMARRADLVLVLEKGRVVERGTHDLLVENRGPYFELFKTQLSDKELRERPKEKV